MSVIATLDSSGWVSSPPEKAAAAFAYFLVSDYSQSVTHFGKIASLPWMLQQYGNDFVILRVEMESVLQTYFSRHFEKAVVSVTLSTKSGDDLSSGRYDMRVSITLYEKGISYSLGRLLSIAANKLKNVIEV